MSSATSTESEPRASGVSSERAADSALEPWQFFTLAGLIGATIVVFLSEGQGPAAIILLSFVIFGAAAVGATAWRTFAPLVGEEGPAGPQILGGRTRAAIEREKTLVLRSIKDLEFDHAMGKVSEKDFAEMDARLRSRAAGLMRQLDAGTGYREDIQREIDKPNWDAANAATSQSVFARHDDRGRKAVPLVQHRQRRRRPVLQELRLSVGGAVRRGHWFMGCTGALALVLGFVGSARAQLEMPDPSMIHGKALPARDLATGTITVRVVREAIGNDIPGRQVTLTIGGVGRNAMTDENGTRRVCGSAGRRERVARKPTIERRAADVRSAVVAGIGWPARDSRRWPREGRGTAKGRKRPTRRLRRPSRAWWCSAATVASCSSIPTIRCASTTSSRSSTTRARGWILGARSSSISRRGRRRLCARGLHDAGQYRRDAGDRDGAFQLWYHVAADRLPDAVQRRPR